MKSIIQELATVAQVIGCSPLDLQYVSMPGQVTREVPAVPGAAPVALVLTFNVPRGLCLLVTDVLLDSALLDGQMAQTDRRQRVMHTPESSLFWSYAAPEQPGVGWLLTPTDTDEALLYTLGGDCLLLFEGGKEVRLWITENGASVSVGMRLHVVASGYLVPESAQGKLSRIAQTV